MSDFLQNDNNIMSTVAKLAGSLSDDLSKTRKVLLELADRLYLRDFPVDELVKLCEQAGYKPCSQCRRRTSIPSKYLKLAEKNKECGHE